MQSEWTFKLVISEKRGGRRYERAIELPLTTFGERLAGEMDLGVAFVGPEAFDQTVHVMKERRFRRDLLEKAAVQLARDMADELEDREGWNGEERQEKIRRT